MRFRVIPHCVGGLLLSVLLFGCDTRTPVEVPEPTRQSEGATVSPQQIPVTIHAVFSGPPNRDPNQISLDDPDLFVQVLNVEGFLPRPASPGDVRIGDDWETGTPAEAFAVFDINNNSVLDIQLRWSIPQLIDDGHLGSDTEIIDVWGRDPTDQQLYHGRAVVEIIAPPAMEELVVVNDFNPFHNIAIDFEGTDNIQFVRNLVNFQNQGPRSDGTAVWWDRGRNSVALAHTNFLRTVDVIVAEGFTVDTLRSDVGDPLLDIPLNVRSIWLWTPRVDYTTAEINALKQFVVEGGRIVFLGENGAFYTPAGLATMNSFLTRMGTSIRTVGGTAGVGYTTTTNIEPHPLMAGVTALRFAGAGILEVGAAADIMFWDHTGANILAATEPIDPTPLTGRESFRPFAGPYLPVEPGLSDTGQ